MNGIHRRKKDMMVKEMERLRSFIEKPMAVRPVTVDAGNADTRLLSAFQEVIREASPELMRMVLDKLEKPRTLQQTSCLLYTSPSPRDRQKSRMPSSA